MDWNVWAEMRFDVLTLLASVTLLVTYHAFLFFKVRSRHGHTFQSVASRTRRYWTQAIMAEGKDILAIQTLRNSTMAATFLASTAIFLITGVLTLSAQGDKLQTTWQALNMLGGAGPELWLLKCLLMLIDLFAAFLSFSMAIRFFHHVGYMINVPISGKYGRIPPELVAAQLERAGNFYWFGMRTYYLLVPLVLWYFGPVFMFTATLIVLAMLARLDRMPHANEHEIQELPPTADTDADALSPAKGKLISLKPGR